MPYSNVTCCVGTQLDLFQGPCREISQESSRYVAHFPLTSLAVSGPLEFSVDPSPMYTDLSDTRLYIRARVVKRDGSPIEQGAQVAPVNMVFHALFRRVDVYLGNRQITQSNDNYPWKAAIETILNFGKDSKESQLHGIGYHKDIVGDATGLIRRNEMIANSRSFELMGPLHVDMFFQERYLLSEMPLRVVLTRNAPDFLLHSADAAPDYKVQFQQAALFVRRVKLSPTIELAHAKALEHSNAIYPINKTDIEIIPIPANMRILTRDNLFSGKIPKKIVIGVLMTASGLHGGYNDSPFRFVNGGVHRVDLTLDGEPVGDTPLSCDFDNGLYLRAYQSIFRAANKEYTDFGTDISYSDFKDMYCLFCFDLTTDSCGNTDAHFETERKGHLRLTIGFKGTNLTMYAIVYGEFESVLEITKAREVLA